MTALPVSVGETAVREAVGRLSAVEPGPYEIVSTIGGGAMGEVYARSLSGQGYAALRHSLYELAL